MAQALTAAKWKGRVAEATVRIEKVGGQGVLVPGGFILTAAHCIEWDGSGGMALGDYYIETVKTKRGDILRVGPWAADPVSDMAVLGPLDDQAFGEDCAAFEEWTEATAAVPVTDVILNAGDSLPVEILSHDRGWIGGTVTRYGLGGTPRSGCVCLETTKEINGGTSGGPVVDSAGKLVGVVSNVSEGGRFGFNGAIPIANLALPRWVWALISTAEKGE
jgi:Trypsin-like peptidase domain